jgi:hypothetical protein
MEALEPSMVCISSFFGFTKADVESWVWGGGGGGSGHFTDECGRGVGGGGGA